MNFAIIIPTKNSSNRIGTILDRYREFCIEPIFIFDVSSNDSTLEILKFKSASVHLFDNKFAYAEAGMIEFGVSKCKQDWILRMDDDEFPSKKLLNWIKKYTNSTACGAWSISRREIIFVNNDYYFTKWPSRYGVGGDYKNYNNQLRLFNKNSVVFTNEVHSPGVKCEGKIGFVPSDFFFVHMNCIIRNPTERINKIRSYAKYDNYRAWKYIDEYLPEIFPLECLNISNDDLHEFVNLFNELHQHESISDIQLTENEIKSIFKECTTWILETHHLSLKQIEIYHKSMSNPLLLYLPIFILKPYSKLLLSLSRYSLFKIASNHAYKSWKLLELKQKL